MSEVIASMTTQKFLDYRKSFSGDVRAAIKPVIFAVDPAMNMSQAIIESTAPSDLRDMCLEEVPMSVKVATGVNRCDYIRVQAATPAQCVAILRRVFSGKVAYTFVELVK